MIGYSEDFEKFTLCEAVYTHFKNQTKPTGPIIAINVFNPEKYKEEGGSQSVALINKVGYIEDDLILSSVKIEGKTQGTDFTAQYEDGKVKIIALKEIESPVLVTYTKTLPENVTKADIIGSIATDGTKTGIYAVDYIYHMHNIVPNILAAPRWSKEKEVLNVLNEKSYKISGKWNAIVVADIESSTTRTVSQAISYKAENQINSERIKLCFPMTKMGGKMVHLSTVLAVVMQMTDSSEEAGGTPYISPSNKAIDISGTFLQDETSLILDFESANLLNEKGITTAIPYGGTVKTWGPHMANYDSSDESIMIEKLFDSSVRMGDYMYNEFQRKNMAQVDMPMSKRQLDNILDESKVWLNGLVSAGKIIKGDISFKPDKNATQQVMSGDFVFDIATTNTPNTKSLTFRIRQSTDGLELLFGGDETNGNA